MAVTLPTSTFRRVVVPTWWQKPRPIEALDVESPYFGSVPSSGEALINRYIHNASRTSALVLRIRQCIGPGSTFAYYFSARPGFLICKAVVNFSNGYKLFVRFVTFGLLYSHRADYVTNVKLLYYGDANTTGGHTLHGYRPLIESFRKLSPVLRNTRNANHPHWVEASNRSAYHSSIIQLAKDHDYEPYFVGFSKRGNTYGYHKHYRSADHVYAESCSDMSSNSCLILCDTDYHYDMPQLMSYCRPMLLYTFSPCTIAGSFEKTSWHIQNGVVRCLVRGGLDVRHVLYNYFQSEYVQVKHKCTYFVYRVDWKRVDPTRVVVLLTPHWFGSKAMADVPFLLPMNTRNNDHDVLVTGFGDTDLYSVALLDGSYAIMTYNSYFDVRNHFINVSKLEHHSIQTAIERRNAKVEGAILSPSAEAASVLLSLWSKRANFMVQRDDDSLLGRLRYHLYYRRQIDKLLANDGLPTYFTYRVMGPSNRILDTNAKPEELYESGRSSIPAMEMVVPPMSNQSACPIIDMKTAAVGIYERAQKVNACIDPPVGTSEYVREFIQYTKQLLREKQVNMDVEPYPLDAILARQQSGLQKPRNARTVRSGPPKDPKLAVKAFVKAEPTAGAARNISGTNNEYQLELSRYTIAVKERILKELEWYCPGLTPPQIADRVNHFVNKVGSLSGAGFVAECDFSKFDGSITRGLREQVELPVLASFMSEEAAVEFLKLARQELDLKLAQADGFKYDPLGARLSGSPLTTDGNTIISAFLSYVAHRSDVPSESSSLAASIQYAYSRIGLHYGDDGLDVPLRTTDFAAVAKTFGLQLKVEIKDSKSPLKFLGRVFLTPSISLESIQDPVRTWTNMCFARRGSNEWVTKINWLAKVQSYYMTDPNTPLLGSYCRAALRLAQKYDRCDQTYLQSHMEDRSWMGTEPRSWPILQNRENALIYVSTVLRVPAETIHKMEKALDNAKTWKALNEVVTRFFNSEKEIDLRATMVGYNFSHGETVMVSNISSAKRPEPTRGSRPSRTSRAGNASNAGLNDA